MTEIWKDINGYEGLYQVSNFGNVKSLHKYAGRTDRILSPGKTKRGYLGVYLFKNGKGKSLYVHRLVAQAFIPNPNDLSEVNHIDEDKHNNRVDNLEWCDRQYNVEYSMCISVNQYTLDGVFIRQWKSAGEASKELLIDRRRICSVCNGEPHCITAGGFIWRYA